MAAGYDAALSRAVYLRAAASAALALAIFLGVGHWSGTIPVNDGFGWDGVAYARMVTEALREGTANTAMRPLLILAVRVPHALGINLLDSFRLVNAASALLLFVATSVLLARCGARPLVQAAIPINLALCIATSKMFGFYPALIDLGALAVIVTAFHIVRLDWPVLTAITCVAAGFSREFGIAVALYGIHRAVRLRRPWAETAAVYLPALLVPVVLRIPAFGFVTPGTHPSAIANAIEGARMLASPSFVIAVGYFTATLFGGLSLVLLARPLRCWHVVRREPELLTFLAIVSFLTIAAGPDIWRYLIFALPVVLVLAAACWQDLAPGPAAAVVVAMLAITVLTQRPLQPMTVDAYFRDWFPMYLIGGSPAQRAEVISTWWPRIAAVPVYTAALALLLRWGMKGTRRDALHAP